jgi:hypothetical protein
MAPEHHGQRRHDRDCPRQHIPLDIEQRQENPQQRVDADLGQQSREQAGHDDARGVIGGRQPEIDRESRRLHREGEQEHRCNREQRPVLAQ